MNSRAQNKISIHREWCSRVWQGIIQQNTAEMDAKSLTSPSGPRADSSPSAFSSAFCKTMSNVTCEPRKWVQEGPHSNLVVYNSHSLLLIIIQQSLGINAFSLCFSSLSETRQTVYFIGKLQGVSKSQVWLRPGPLEMGGLCLPGPQQLKMWQHRDRGQNPKCPCVWHYEDKSWRNQLNFPIPLASFLKMSPQEWILNRSWVIKIQNHTKFCEFSE